MYHCNITTLFRVESKQLMFERKTNVETNDYSRFRNLEIFFPISEIKFEYAT